MLTDGTVLVLESGELLRRMNTRDGYALKHAQQQGYHIAVITGGKSEGVISRLKALGVNDVFTGVSDKKRVLERYLKANQISRDTVMYMGDDLPDYHAMRMTGLPACPHDAAHEIIELSRYISPYKGGEGCVRDIIEKVMRLHDRWLDEVQIADEAKIKFDGK